MRKFFGTDGIRGVAGVSPLDPESLVRLGKAIATVFLKRGGKHRVLIGKDTRLSGYMIETSLSAGITACGADLMLVGPLPTPGVAYLTKSMRADAGIVVSASHNSFEDNGIKIFGADGLKLADGIEQELEALMQPGVLDHKVAASNGFGKAVRINDAVGRYTVFLKSCFPRELSLAGLKIGIDCANGASYVVAPQTFSELGAEVVARGISPNGRNINAGFGSLHPDVVARLVVEQGLDVGIAFDGDADRLMLVDEKGSVHDGDVVLAICAIDLKSRGELRGSQVVGTVMSNLGLEKLLDSHGIQLLRSAVGDRYVLEEMVKTGAQIGGEQSGHCIFSDVSSTGDGILSALQVLAVMGRTGKKLSELAAALVRFPQQIVNVPVAKRVPFSEVPKLQAMISATEASLGKSGRLLVRYSGTELKVRVMVECENDASCTSHVNAVADVVRSELAAPSV